MHHFKKYGIMGIIIYTLRRRSMEDPGSQDLILQFVLLFVLTLLNAFFSATEMSMVSLNRSRVEQKAEEGDKKYIRLLKVLENPNHFLSTIQVGITLITILSGASLANDLGKVIASWMGNTETARAMASFLSLAFLTYISIVFGELYPKRIAMNLKDSLAIRTAPIVILLGKIVSPFVWLLSASTNLVSRLTPMQFDDADEEMSRDERELMVPRTDAFMVDIQDDTREIIESILKQNFSRIPVYDDDKDNVIGLIHTKRLLNEGFVNGFENIFLRKILQEPLFVPETIFVDDLLKELRNTQNQMAILLDEYGGMAGLVTLEDLLEEIVGEIDDETDKAENDVFEIEPNLYIVQGIVTLNDFNEYFDVKLESDDVDTIAGYYLTGVGRIPGHKERLSFEVDSMKKHLILTNDKVKNGRVTKVKVEVSDLVDEEETISKLQDA